MSVSLLLFIPLSRLPFQANHAKQNGTSGFSPQRDGKAGCSRGLPPWFGGNGLPAPIPAHRKQPPAPISLEKWPAARSEKL